MKTLGITILIQLLFSSFNGYGQVTFVAPKYGITDLKKATDLSPIEESSDSIQYQLLESSRNGSLGLDIITQVGQSSKNFIELGFYYSSTTLAGNSGFRYQFIYSADFTSLDTSISATNKYGNMKIGYGRKIVESKRASIITFFGLDMEYGETTIISPDFKFSTSDGYLKMENIFLNNALLVGPYARASVLLSIGEKYGLIVTPSLKFSFKFEDDFENDETDVSVSKFGFEFSAGIFKSF